MKKRYLFTPGPVPVSDQLLAAMSEPTIHHRSTEFEKVFADLTANLKLIFQTKEAVYVQAASGTGGLESAVVNTLSPNDRVIVVNSGKFGERWEKICRSHYLTVVPIKVPWGQAVSPDQVSRLLDEHPDTRALLCQACETSTGVMHPIKALSQLTKNRPETLILVDGISAIGGVDLPMDQWGLDVVVSGSQKGLAGPTGVTFIALSKKAWAFNKKAQCPRYYFDLRAERLAYDKNQTRFSAPTALLNGLNVSLNHILQTGLKKHFQRTNELAMATRTAGKILGLTLFPKSPSPTLTAFEIPPSIDGQKLKEHLEVYHQITVAGGQEQLKGKVFRVGHMGEISDSDLIYFIEKLGQSLSSLGAQGINDDLIGQAIQATRAVLCQ